MKKWGDSYFNITNFEFSVFHFYDLNEKSKTQNQE